MNIDANTVLLFLAFMLIPLAFDALRKDNHQITDDGLAAVWLLILVVVVVFAVLSEEERR